MKLVADLPPPPPDHLSPMARELWATTCERYMLDPHHLHLLALACSALDRCEEARQMLAKDGMTVHGQQGLKPHPAVAIERDSRLALRACSGS